ncbi:MAG: hypothetical protein ACYDDA_15610 [Acidiferrobacteraceae bacterium]
MPARISVVYAEVATAMRTLRTRGIFLPTIAQIQAMVAGPDGRHRGHWKTIRRHMEQFAQENPAWGQSATSLSDLSDGGTDPVTEGLHHLMAAARERIATEAAAVRAEMETRVKTAEAAQAQTESLMATLKEQWAQDRAALLASMATHSLLKRECEQLRSEKNSWSAEREALQAVIQGLKGEIEALRTQQEVRNAEYRAWMTHADHAQAALISQRDHAIAQGQEARALAVLGEIDRVRTALGERMGAVEKAILALAGEQGRGPVPVHRKRSLWGHRRRPCVALDPL